MKFAKLLIWLECCASLALMVLGLSRTLSYSFWEYPYSGFSAFHKNEWPDFLDRMAIISAASPVPAVFSREGDFEMLLAGYSISLQNRNSIVYSKVFQSKDHSRVAYPFWRNSVFMFAIAHNPDFDSKRRNRILKIGFCSGGRMANQYGLSDYIYSSFSYRVSTRGKGGEKFWVTTVNCTE